MSKHYCGIQYYYETPITPTVVHFKFKELRDLWVDGDSLRVKINSRELREIQKYDVAELFRHINNG